MFFVSYLSSKFEHFRKVLEQSVEYICWYTYKIQDVYNDNFVGKLEFNFTYK